MKNASVHLLCAFLALWPGDLSSQPVLRVDSLFSERLGTTKAFSILLPASYDPGRRYPVLFLLHGYGGNHKDWTSRTQLVRHIAQIPLLIVMPDAENSWYVNSQVDPRRKFEDYFVNDLRGYIARQYGVDTSRMAIAGLSMGGYGALLLALKHPGLFRFAGSLSGALSVPGDLDAWEKASWGKRIAPSLRTAFGSSEAAKTKNDLISIIRNSRDTSFPFLYLAMGTADGFPTFLPAHRSITDSLRAYGLAYEYHETPGGHNWSYWDREIVFLLKRLQEILRF